MKKIIVPIALAAVGAVLWAKAPKDPVIMTIDGQPVSLSEFEYLRNKNAGQQLEEETLEQYLDRFINYKLKVTQARHEGLDTTTSFRQEYGKYRKELAQPYLQDTTIMEKVYEQCYTNSLEEIELDHLMVSLNERPLIDSLRQAILAGADFLDLAERFSKDPSLKRNGGHYGWVTTGVYPYEFESVAWATPKGEVSEVITTPYGYHLVKVLDRRPSAGQVHAAHILVNEKYDADSLYNLLLNGAEFEQLARDNSTCGSAPGGGNLGWFGRRQMVPEFETVAFGLADGAISEPFESRFGWHIVKRYNSRHTPKEEALKQIKAQSARDSRAKLPAEARAEELKKEYKTRIVEESREKLLTAIVDSGYDAAVRNLKQDASPLIIVGDSVVTISDFLTPAPSLNPYIEPAPQIQTMLPARLNTVVLEYESNRLGQKYPDFRNVDREYREGLMLFAASEKHIWNRPTEDPEGLKAFFEANRDKYNDWTEPRWKGFIIYATADSLIQQVNEFLAEAKPDADSVGKALKEKFPRNIRIERVVLPAKNNQIVDYIAFNGPEPKFSDKVTMRYFTPYLGHLIYAPEEVADIRGRVSGDWIEALEKEWVDQLRHTYPVKVNNKVLKKVK